MIFNLTKTFEVIKIIKNIIKKVFQIKIKLFWIKKFSFGKTRSSKCKRWRNCSIQQWKWLKREFTSQKNFKLLTPSVKPSSTPSPCSSTCHPSSRVATDRSNMWTNVTVHYQQFRKTSWGTPEVWRSSFWMPIISGTCPR